MDDLDRIQAANEPREEERIIVSDDPPKLENFICRIGCIRTENGWYGLGYNEHTKALKLLERIG